jgi:NTE family protein
VGALKGISEIVKMGSKSPFSILSGTSAGAINAIALGTQAYHFTNGIRWLEALWSQLSIEHVYRTDLAGISMNALRLTGSLFNANIAQEERPVALLDNVPLREFLRRELNFNRLSENIRNGHVEAVCITAMNYSEGKSISFFQGGPQHSNWERWRREGISTPLELRHIMASTAIPTIFPPQRIGNHYYGDGALRQLAPLSSALHLGAEKILVIPPTGNKRNYAKPIKKINSPAFGQIIGHLLNSAFVDTIVNDIEFLQRINELLKLVPPEKWGSTTHPLKPVDILVISPSRDIDTLAEKHVKSLPFSLKLFLSRTRSGDYSGGVNVASYLLFCKPFIDELIELGYRDALRMEDEIHEFLTSNICSLRSYQNYMANNNNIVDALLDNKGESA